MLQIPECFIEKPAQSVSDIINITFLFSGINYLINVCFGFGYVSNLKNMELIGIHGKHAEIGHNIYALLSKGK